MSEKAFSRTTVRATALLATTLLSTSFAAGFAHADTTTSGYGTSNGTGTIGPAAPGDAITRAQIITRAQDWMNAQVPYSQTEGYEDSGTGGPYRMDCSGFVSMAWGLPTSMVTSTLPEVSTVTAANITGDTNLNPGDALDYTADHVVLFDHWTDGSGDFAYDAEHTTGQVANQSTDNIYDSTLEGYAMSDFEALQYSNLSTVSPPAAPSVTITGPGNNASVNGNVTISASVSDATSGVSSSTQFYVVQAGSSTNTPFGSPVSGTNPSIVWPTSGLTTADYVLGAVTTVTNSAGSSSAAAPGVSVVVVAPAAPSVTITSPSTGARLANGTVTVSASVSDPTAGANLTTVFYATPTGASTAPVEIGSASGTSPSITWNDARLSGAYTLTARSTASDGVGASAATTSRAVSVIVPQTGAAIAAAGDDQLSSAAAGNH
jgi:hypothetical protein